MNNDNINRGQIWPTAEKGKDTHPDFKGSLNVRGEEFRILAWKRKKGANHKAPSLSISVQPMEETTKEQPKDYVVKTDNHFWN